MDNGNGVIANIHHFTDEFDRIGKNRLASARNDVITVGIIHPLKMRPRAIVFYMVNDNRISLETIAIRFNYLAVGIMKKFIESNEDADKGQQQQ